MIRVAEFPTGRLREKINHFISIRMDIIFLKKKRILVRVWRNWNTGTCWWGWETV